MYIISIHIFLISLSEKFNRKTLTRTERKINSHVLNKIMCESQNDWVRGGQTANQCQSEYRSKVGHVAISPSLYI